MVGAALGLVVLEEVCAYLAFTLAIPTTKRSLIIRTEIRTRTRERLKTELFIWALDIRPIIGRNGIPSRGESQSVCSLQGDGARGWMQKVFSGSAVLHFQGLPLNLGYEPSTRSMSAYSPR